AGNTCQLSSMIWRSLMICISGLLERLDADAAITLQERLFDVVAHLQVPLEHRLDGVDYLMGAKRGANDLADRRLIALATAEHELVSLVAVLVDAQDTDVT